MNSAWAVRMTDSIADNAPANSEVKLSAAVAFKFYGQDAQASQQLVTVNGKVYPVINGHYVTYKDSSGAPTAPERAVNLLKPEVLARAAFDFLKPDTLKSLNCAEQSKNFAQAFQNYADLLAETNSTESCSIGFYVRFNKIYPAVYFPPTSTKKRGIIFYVIDYTGLGRPLFDWNRVSNSIPFETIESV